MVGSVSVGGIYWLLVGIFQGISSTSFSERERMVPNRGIRRSIRNGLLLGSLSAGVAALISGLSSLLTDVLSIVLIVVQSFGMNVALSDGLSYGLSYGPGRGLLIGLSAGLLVILLMGGLAWWQHWVVRFLLWRSGAMPWCTVQMLDEAARHILLRKSGGGYRFVHDLFRDYLASDTFTSLPRPVVD